ncbi:glycosyltransferase [Parasphingopyxis marina]|uniref:Glycosyltransferase n=1 Tax=Parasphingopyxis marina TaxID=2761622 RepID=A0A842HXT4_9SPHN|nr:glycosyltransferase [Parasphingopyxis marina]MBC2777752.1 glycosyltransferase [Parasphingopyxis marina]
MKPGEAPAIVPCGRSEALARKYSELAALGTGQLPGLLICWPTARANKFQSLLYRRAETHGFAVERIVKLEELDEIYWPGPVIFHAHWFGPLANKVETESEYRQVVENALQSFDALRRRTGAKFVWTAHNTIPHGSRYPEVDTELRRRIIADFDAVHFMDESHAALLEEAFGLGPRHAFVARHPHYDPAHADHLERSEARETLGIDPGATLLLFFGSIQRYKGLNRLIAAFAEASKTRPDLRLVITGIPSDADYVAEVGDAVAGVNAVRFLPYKVPDDEIQRYFRAADAAVLPYSGEQLNSGAAMLALSFDCPIIAPRAQAFAALERFNVTLYADTGEHALARALAGFEHRSSTIDFAAFREAHDPVNVSDAFFKGLEPLKG